MQSVPKVFKAWFGVSVVYFIIDWSGLTNSIQNNPFHIMLNEHDFQAVRVSCQLTHRKAGEEMLLLPLIITNTFIFYL